MIGIGGPVANNVYDHRWSGFYREKSAVSYRWLFSYHRVSEVNNYPPDVRLIV